ATGKVFDGLDAVLAEPHQHRRGDAFDVLERVFDAKLFALGIEFGFDLGQVFARARLQFAGGILVKTFDAGDLLNVDHCQFLDRIKAFRSQQLSDHLVDVERVDEHARAVFEFRLAPFGFLLLGQDVDVPAGELRGEADVLAAAANGKRELLVGHYHLDALAFFVEHYFGDLGGGQRVDDEGGDVVRPWNDIDLLALQLV